MTAPNMAALTTSLERSLQNFSLNHTTTTPGGYGSSSTSTDEASPPLENRRRRRNNLYNHRIHPSLSSSSSSSSSSSNPSDPTAATKLVELNSHVSLPYHWEQCLDLKTGEVYYINWRNGMKAKEDPRLATNTTTVATTPGYCGNYDYYSYSEEAEEEEEEDEDEEEDCESEGSSTEYSSPSSRESYKVPVAVKKGLNSNENMSKMKKGKNRDQGDVLVVAGCKSCLMYYMVPAHVEECPKCAGHLFHFDRSDHSI